MQTNPEIEQITDYAIHIARKKQNEYVLVEHLLLSLIRHEPFNKCLVNFGTNVDNLDLDLDQ